MSPAALLPAADNPYLSPPAFTFYGAILVAIISFILAPVMQRRIEVERDAAKAAAEKQARQTAIDEAEAEAKAEEAIETSKWLRTQVGKLQETIDRQAVLLVQVQEGNAARDRTVEQLRATVATLQRAARQYVQDSRARDGRIAQLEGVLVAAGMTVPAAEPQYRELLERERFTRTDQQEDS